MISGNLVFLIFVTMIAAVINTTTGFGFGILSVPMYSLVMPTVLAVAVAGLLTFILSSWLAKINFRQIIWKQIFIPLPIAMLAGYACVYFTDKMPEHLIKRVLGVVLMLLSVYFLRYSERIRLRPTAVNGILMGIVGGSLQGLFSMGGPPMVLYYLSTISDKNQYMATLQVYFVFINISVLLMRFQQGYITGQCWRYFWILLLPMFAGMWLGVKLFRRMDEKRLRTVTYWFMLVCGGWFLING